MAMLSGTFHFLSGKDKSIFIISVVLCLCAFALVDSASGPDFELLDRAKRAVVKVTVNVPDPVPENVTSGVILYDLAIPAPNRNYKVTGSSANNTSLFVVTNSKLSIAPNLEPEVRKLFDYEKFKTFEVEVNATNKTDDSDVIMLTVRIQLTDVNDESPVMANEPKPFLATLSQNAPPETVVYTLSVVDTDSSADVDCHMDQDQSAVVSERFRLVKVGTGTGGSKQFNIITVGSGSFQAGAEYKIKIVAWDKNGFGGAQQKAASVAVLIGNRPPQFYEPSYLGRIYESVTPTTQNWVLEKNSGNLLQIRVRSFQNNALTFVLLDQNGELSELFRVLQEDMVQKLQNIKPIDFETVQTISLTMKATEANTGLTSTVPITITVLDENDNPPSIISQYSSTVQEDTPVGKTILTGTVNDIDSGVNGDVVFSLSNTTYFDVTTMPNKTFAITVKSPLDFDTGPGYYQFNLIVSDKGIPSLSSTSLITVNLLNVNDNPPTIVNSTTIFLPQKSVSGTVVTIVQASDKDGDSVKFYFGGEVSISGIFTIQDTNGLITLNNAIPSNMDDDYKLTVVAIDDGSCCVGTKQLSSTATLTVSITDINANKPEFKTCSQYDMNARVKELSQPGTPVIQVSASDPDRGDNGKVYYRLLVSDSPSNNDLFDINRETGNITVKGTILRGRDGFVQVTVVAYNPTPFSSSESTCSFRVTIDDVNDNKPTFSQAVFEIRLSSGTPPGSIVNQMVAFDKDVGPNANLTYSLINNDTETRSTFSINRINGIIKLEKELSQSYILIVVANDNGVDPGPLSGTATVSVVFVPADGKPPEWINIPDNEAIIYSVSESEAVGFLIATLSCKSNSNQSGVEFRVFDADKTIAIDSAKFDVTRLSVEENGAYKTNLTLRDRLDYETVKEHIVILVCQSRTALVSASRISATIKVLDANDERPEFQGLNQLGRYNGTVKENATGSVLVLRVSATDRDTDPPFRTVTFFLGNDSDSSMFRIESNGNNSGELWTVGLLPFDWEAQRYYSIKIFAVDGAVKSPPDPQNPLLHNIADRFIDIYVTDINDNPPKFQQSLYVFNVSESAFVNEPVGVVKADDPDLTDQSLGLDYRITQGNVNNAFIIIFGIGEIRVARKLDYENTDKVFSLTVIAVDSGQLHTATTSVNIFVENENDNFPIFERSVYVVNDTVYENDDRVTPQNPLFLVTVKANDADDSRPETSIRYSIYSREQNDAQQLFTVNDTTGNVYLIGKLDRDVPPHFTSVTIEAKDEAINPLSGFTTVQVYPKDVNDNYPVFKSEYLTGQVQEHAKNTCFMILVATDIDNGDNGTVKFRLSDNQLNSALSSMFKVKEGGEICTGDNVTLLDRETIEEVFLTVEAYDLGVPSLTTSARVTIHVIDINDQSPFFEKSLYIATMSEAQMFGPVITISATDLDSDPKNKNLFFTLMGRDSDLKFFQVLPRDNPTVIYNAQPVDYETDPHVFKFTLMVNDTFPGHQNTTQVEITILDANDNYPIFEEPEKSVTLVEEEPPGKYIANFTATDKDEGLNGEVVYTIARSSDPRYEFYVYPGNGSVITRKRLDREIQDRRKVLILATDRGETPLSSTATLSVSLTDINDNPPRFLEDYHPVVPENENNNNRLVQDIYAFDPDTLENGPPFGFSLPSSCNEPVCQLFSFVFNPAGNGSATIRTSATFDREKQKYYFLPIVMWDRRDKNNSRTATNTLTITIGDQNDNELQPGNQNIFVYNYKGQFADTEIGRVYADDPDDWDLPDKTFTNLLPKTMDSYFSVNEETGMITMKPGVPANNGKDPYQFTVDVYDKKYDKTVRCTVSVTVQLLSDEAVRNSGGVRLSDITAEEFIKPVYSGTPNTPSTSKYEQFRQTVASMMGYPSKDNVEIVSMEDGDGFLDVRFSAHASPYVQPSQGESAIMLNLAEFEKAVGVKVNQVPINLCMDEIYDDGCYNFLDVTGNPELINSNGTSYVVMKTTLTAQAGCVDSMFPDPVECRGDYCFNGGTCLKDDWNKLSCACLPGFDGPRCQQRRHSFDGSSATFYEGLSACSEGRTSIEFITKEENGLIMFSGPITAIDVNQDVRDYLILELKGGYPYLRLNLGTYEASIQINGKSASGAPVMNKLNDGQWHHIDIDRNNQELTLTVDHCNAAKEQSNGTVFDWSPCRMTTIVPGPDVLLNVHSLLQLGGRYPKTQAPNYPSGVTTSYFKGCLRNLVHNTKLYDLYYKEMPSWNSGSNGCQREDAICGTGTAQPACGVNATCEGRWDPDVLSSCRCNPGWYGDKCAKEAPTKDLGDQSYFMWELDTDTIAVSKRVASFQMMFRTRQENGTLFVLTNADANKILLELVNGRLSLSYGMGQGSRSLVLSNAPANVGQWTVVRVERYGNEFLLSMDGGEGRYYTYQVIDPNLGVLFEVQPRVTVGAIVTSAEQISGDLQKTCVRDVRYNGKWLPMIQDQNNDPKAGVSLYKSMNIKDGCVRDDCNPNTCRDDQICYPLWEGMECRCKPGTVASTDACVSACVPNPCFNNGICSIVAGSIACTCVSGWTGPFCTVLGQVSNDDSGLGAGPIVGIVIAIIVLLILIILLLIFLLSRKRSEKEKIIEVDPDDDFIRENVMFYDEEGAGEEDHAAYDITLLQRPVKESNAKPIFYPPTETDNKPRNAPRVDRPDVAPNSNRPDVGSFIKDRIRDVEDEEPNADSTREFNYEGGNSDAGSLSSLNTSSSGGSQDYNYLSEWGPKFAKLADMYGAGQNQDNV